MSSQGSPIRIAVNTMRARLTILGFNLAIITFQLTHLSNQRSGTVVPGFDAPLHLFTRYALEDVEFDDGFIAYLNGVEVAREDMPDGPVDRNTEASSHEAGTPVTISLGPVGDFLTSGTNVLAIEGHIVPPPFGGQFDGSGFHDSRILVLPPPAKYADAEIHFPAAVLAARPDLQTRSAGQVEAAVLLTPVARRVLPGDTDPAAPARESHANRVLALSHIVAVVAVQRQRIDVAHPS